jgi:hypothetical protein
MPDHKNSFRTVKQVNSHARYWHKRKKENTSAEASTISADSFEFNATANMGDLNDTHANDGMSWFDDGCRFSFAHKPTAQFAEWCIAGSVKEATHCLVRECLFLAPVSLYLESSARLPLHVIDLFFNIAHMLFLTGATHHEVLSKILESVIRLIPADKREWPTMPSTLAGFQSHVLNPTNSHSLVSILPAPYVSMLPDGAHAYCCLQEIAAFVLLFPRTLGVAPIPLRLRQLCRSQMMQDFLFTTPPCPSETWMGPKCLLEK